MTTLKLDKYCNIKAMLVCRTGLHIGGTESAIGIGSAENPVIKDARGMPYIPGSSLKGKMRSLLEYKYNRVWNDGGPCQCGSALEDCPVCTIFGPHRNTNHSLGPTRIIVRDAFLSPKSAKEWEECRAKGVDFTETKKETSINRKRGMALNHSLRTQERVNAGTEFALNISIRVFEGDDIKAIISYVQEALDMISNDTLGGSGTRGYGWVEIRDMEVTGC